MARVYTDIPLKEAVGDLSSLVARAQKGETFHLLSGTSIAAVLAPPNAEVFFEEDEDEDDLRVTNERLKDLAEGRSSTVSWQAIRAKYL